MAETSQTRALKALIRQREDDGGKWDVIEEGQDGRPRVNIISTPEVVEYQNSGRGGIVSGEEWGKRAEELSQDPDERVFAINPDGTTVSTTRKLARSGGRRIVSKEEADKAYREGNEAVSALTPDGRGISTTRLGAKNSGYKVVPEEQAAEANRLSESMASANRAAGERILAQLEGRPTPFQGLSAADAAEAERGVSDFKKRLAALPTDKPKVAAKRPAQITIGRPQQEAAPRQFQALAAGTGVPMAQKPAVAEAQSVQLPQEDTGIGGALDESRQRALMLALSRAGGMVNTALTGAKPDASAFDGMEASTNNPVRDYIAKKAEAEANALKDPTSEQSRRFQMAVAKALPGVYTPEEIAQMTAQDEKLILNAGEMRQQLDFRRDQIAAQERAREDEQTWRAEQANLARQDRRDARADAAANRALRRDEINALKQQDREQKMAERNVGGFTFDPTNPPTPQAAKTMAEAAVARDEINGSLERLEKLFDDNGTETFGGSVQSEMEAELENITNKVRVLNQMGVPNKQDYERLARQIPDPTGLSAMFTRNSSIKPKFKALREQVERTVEATARAYKYRPMGEQLASAAMPAQVEYNGKKYTKGADGNWVEL